MRRTYLRGKKWLKLNDYNLIRERKRTTWTDSERELAINREILCMKDIR